MVRSVLGRGLDALIPKGKAVNTDPPEPSRIVINSNSDNVVLFPDTATERIEYLDIKLVDPNPNQPRTDINKETLKELSDSIKEHGLIQPILVAKASDNKFRIIAGERRWRASKAAGLSSIPAIIRDETLTRQNELELALIENLQREDLNPIEEAMAFKRLAEEHNLSHEEIAKKVSRSRSAIANSIRLLSLPAEIRLALQEGKVKATQVRPLLNLSDDEAIKIYRRIGTETLSVRSIEEIAADKKGKRPQKARSAATDLTEENSLFPDTAERLMRRLGRKVKIVGTEEKGQIKIEYYSRDDLLSLTDYLLGEL